ncbi:MULTISPECIES: sulfite exporter TauE/SafE family protein [Aeromonas]|uniref:sulfite exporter TauE/SafE family protein n=1 Tax=Aeromonas TaxID=642 RepID=UPI00084AA3AC|nr:MULTISPECIES: sulfite exporter TauE/SafE family protein [Aeromonas]MBO0399394.1 sulfite exporter TauE/SafE family protein [Aeromonas veronii]MCF3097174.1 sulfite exporter TauE/SafE family protein [Aeromonas australiensis]MCF5844195.1 sulfite exporter TauE/SafE family protein [Aeromonas veronii]MCQ4111549.1 sulfite exporter TauE/SafE family protein [Aeromonas sp. JL9]MCX0441588.1 sulfite exporter TauE/SafE family protein [Aeromonas veronii]
MLVDILRLVFIAGGLVFIFMLVQACWRKKQSGSFEATPFWPVALIGGVANFLDTLGVGSFAVKTACYKQFKLIDDRVLPGTLNGQCVLPTVTQSLIFVGAVAVEPLTLISMMMAAAAGAAWGARHVASFDRQTIRLVMAISLLVVAGLIFAGLLGLFPVGGDAMGLSGYKLAIALLGNFIFGVLMNVGIGLFAPCMTLVYLLGMNPLAAFPIMMGSTAVLSVFSAGTFIRKGAFDAKAVLAVAIFGPIGVVLAAMLVKSMDMEMLKWLVAFIVIYTSWTMYASWRAARRSPVQLAVESAG